MAAPYIPDGVIEELGDAEEHYPRKVAQQVNGATRLGTDTIPGPMFCLMIDIPDAATGDVDRVLRRKYRVMDVVIYKTGANGGAANTITVKNGANAITDAISININDNTRAVATTRDDAQYDIAAGGTLRVTRTKAGGNAACQVIVYLLPVA